MSADVWKTETSHSYLDNLTWLAPFELDTLPLGLIIYCPATSITSIHLSNSATPPLSPGRSWLISCTKKSLPFLSSPATAFLKISPQCFSFTADSLFFGWPPKPFSMEVLMLSVRRPFCGGDSLHSDLLCVCVCVCVCFVYGFGFRFFFFYWFDVFVVVCDLTSFF